LDAGARVIDAFRGKSSAMTGAGYRTVPRTFPANKISRPGASVRRWRLIMRESIHADLNIQRISFRVIGHAESF
jgi:hypothetical protein